MPDIPVVYLGPGDGIRVVVLSAQPITQVTPAAFGPYVEGDLPTDAYTPGVYSSVALSLTVTVQWTVNGEPWVSGALEAGDVVGLVELVEDVEGNVRAFDYGAQTVFVDVPLGAFLTEDETGFFITEDGEHYFQQEAA